MKTPQITPEQFQAIYPRVVHWIDITLTNFAAQTHGVTSKDFKRLPLYFSREFLASAKFVVTDRVPVPPLASMGLSNLSDFEDGDYSGITYLDTFFVRRNCASQESLYFHELIHVIQWGLLGPESFLREYANGLSTFGYRNSPLEVMAYSAEEKFNNKSRIFDAEKYVREELKKLLL